MSSRCVIWGDRIMDHYRFGATLNESPQLWRESNPGGFLSLLDKERLLSNALAFPITRRCLARSMDANENWFVDPNCYDPCFLLPLFLQYLTSGKLDLSFFHVYSSKLSYWICLGSFRGVF